MSAHWLDTLVASNTLLVLAATALLGLSCGAIGTFTVLRGRSLVGDALAHAALPGICVSYLIFEQRSFFLLFVGAIFFGLLSVWCINFIRDKTRLKEDAAIAITLSSFFGLGIVLSRIIQNQPLGNRAGLDDFIFGKAASIVSRDVLGIATVSLITLLAIAILFKEFKVLCFPCSGGSSRFCATHYPRCDCSSIYVKARVDDCARCHDRPCFRVLRHCAERCITRT
jgi:manganese/zinc/iron transport system permease protein